MRTAAALLLSWGLAGCASAPPMPPTADLFHDDVFAAPSVRIDPADAMAVSPAMRRYIAERIDKGARSGDRRDRLIDALYRKGELKLEYDATLTRTAAQAFEARSGNCLALVMMTGAFAKEMGLRVHYRIVLGESAWDRAGDLAIEVGHINLTLDDRAPFGSNVTALPDPLTVDFLPPRDGRMPRTRLVEERTVIAMYLNNRAVESMTEGRLDDAYGWARAALAQDPEFLSTYLTLGVIYRDAHRPDYAEAALLRISQREPDNTQALTNRVLVLHDLGRLAEAQALQQRLDRLDPHPPFSYFRLGLAALREHRLEEARRLFEKEIARAPDYHEFQFWLAVTYAEMHDPKRATEHLTRAMEMSTTRRDHDLYAAKLDRLKALTRQ
jgi:tetratricopeptide (TPR) repeat protein